MSDSPSFEASVTLRSDVESPNVSFKLSSFGGFSSTSSFQDSGYSDSLKASSFDYTDVENIEKNIKGLSSTQEYFENSSLGFTCSVDSPPENKNSSSFLRKEVNEVTELCETPKVTKKKTFFRRRLNITNIVSRGDTEQFDKQNCSFRSYIKTPPVSQLLSFEERVSKRALGSPRQTIFTPVATSTLKTDEATSNSQKLRLSFSQHKTSTIDDSKSDCSLFEVECISPIQGSSCTDALTNDFGDSISSINGDTTEPELLGASSCGALCETNEDIFVTPISNLVANIKFCGYSPAEVIDNISTPEDSGFNSLGLDKSQDSFSDHEGSFQELFQKSQGTGRTLGTKKKPRHTRRVRRLSTLRERSSQSETEEDKPFVNSGFQEKIVASGISPNEQIDSNCGDSILGLKDLSKTPALQLVHEIIMKSRRKRLQQSGVRSHLKEVEGGEVSLLEYVLAGLIGKKMGLEKLDILTELKFRNLKHILAMVLDALTVENLCSVWKVSKNWREIVVQDKKANQRRKIYIQQLKAESRQGNILCVEDAATRLNLLNRSALRSVQAQARTPGSQKEEVSTPSPWGLVLTPKECCSVTQLPSKQEEYVKVAKTLFIDEALKPCPRCQSPAKYQPIKKRGLCSREACGFDFCALCLCTYHGAEECSSRSVKPRNKRDALPGSAQSKRNLKRL